MQVGGVELDFWAIKEIDIWDKCIYGNHMGYRDSLCPIECISQYLGRRSINLESAVCNQSFAIISHCVK